MEAENFLLIIILKWKNKTHFTFKKNALKIFLSAFFFKYYCNDSFLIILPVAVSLNFGINRTSLGFSYLSRSS
jgi:hypothetical protein